MRSNGSQLYGSSKPEANHSSIRKKTHVHKHVRVCIYTVTANALTHMYCSQSRSFRLKLWSIHDLSLQLLTFQAGANQLYHKRPRGTDGCGSTAAALCRAPSPWPSSISAGRAQKTSCPKRRGRLLRLGSFKAPYHGR